MTWIKSAVVLLSVLYISSALLMRSDEHLRNKEKMLQFLDENEEEIIAEIQNFTKTGYRSKAFDDWVKAVPYEYEMARLEVEDYSPEQAILTCLACRTYVATLLRDRRAGGSEQALIDSAVNMCGIVTPFDERVCRGVVNINAEPMLFIVDSRPQLTATQMCGMVLQGECSGVDPAFAFTANVSPGPPITGPKTVSAPRAPDELRILHVTDIHYDPHYLIGGLAECINPICCRRADGPATPGTRPAGRWGDFNCGISWEIVENVIRQMGRQHPNVDMVYHTGDMIDHGVWETSRNTNFQIMTRIYNLLKEVFPNIPVYSVIGNHEAHPTNVFAPSSVTRPSLTPNWLYDFTADTWSRHGWLSGAALNTVRSHGYYTVLNRPGFRIIGMNNNDCYVFNWWVLYSRVEIQANMNWLHNTLLAAEQAGERVHILHHLGTNGNSCFKWWSREYRRVIDRFHHIIGGQFNGHSHASEFFLYYDSATAQHAVNVVWNAGSATTYTNNNPNYHLYHVDRTHYQVQDYESWIYNIVEANANQNAQPRWFQHFSFRQAFGITDMSMASLDRFVFDMARNRNIARRYWEFKVKASQARMQGGCNDDCLRGHMCSIVTNEFEEPRRCNQLMAVFGTVA